MKLNGTGSLGICWNTNLYDKPEVSEIWAQYDNSLGDGILWLHSLGMRKGCEQAERGKQNSLNSVPCCDHSWDHGDNQINPLVL